MNDEEQQAKAGCYFLALFLIHAIIIGPAAYGGAVQKIFGIEDMNYGQKWVGALSG